MSSSSSSDSDSDTGNAGNQNLFSGSGSDSTPSHRSASVEHTLPPAQRSDDESDTSPAPETSPKKRRNLISSDDDDDGDRPENSNKPDASALFGDDVSSDSGDDDAQGDARKKEDSDNEKSDGSQGSIHGIRLYPDQDEEEQEEEAPPEIIESEVTRSIIYVPDKQYYCKFPNFLSVETKPFDPDEYEENGDDDTVDSEGRSRLKLKVENTIRWRYSKDAAGNDIKQSNAKMVRWSDGTMSLHLGNEIFDVQEMPVAAHTHLYVKHQSGLSGLTVFEKKLQFRPHSTDSKTHRKVTLNMADRTRKTGQVKMLTEVGANPDEAKREAIRREEELLRAAIRKEHQQRAVRTRDRNRMLTSGFLEERDYSDDEGRRRGRRAGEAPLIGVSDSEDSDGGRRLDAAKDDSDSDEEHRRRKNQSKKKIISSDEDESD